MVVKIRLARFGKRNAPFYNIVVAQARSVFLLSPIHPLSSLILPPPRSARNSKPLEVLGTYDPIPKPAPLGEGKPFKDIKLDTARAKYWLGVGAQPSDPAWRLLSMVCPANFLRGGEYIQALGFEWRKEIQEGVLRGMRGGRPERAQGKYFGSMSKC